MLACAVAGFAVTVREDHRLAAVRHAALKRAIDELHSAFGGSDLDFDEARLPLITRLAALPDLHFDRDEANTSGREVQSVHDARGRISGWLSWAPDRALIRAMYWLWSLAGAVGIVLGVSALRTVGLIQRQARLLTASLRTIRKLTREDALTGLPNHRVMLELLDRALREPHAGAVMLALVDPDSLREVNDTLGRTGGDALLKSIAERLQAAVSAGAQFGRFDDDEFAVIVAGADFDTANRLADTFKEALARPIFMEQNWQISVGIGIAQAPADGNTAEELSRRANLALVPPNAGVAAWCSASSPQSRWRKPNSGSCAVSWKRLSARARCRCTTSRRSPPPAAPWSGSKRCCAGLIRTAAPSRRRCSFRLLRRAA